MSKTTTSIVKSAETTLGENLLVNGDFESNALNNSGYTTDLNSLSGWSASGAGGYIFESDYGNGNGDGNGMVELWSGEALSQTVNLAEAGTYQLSLDMSTRLGTMYGTAEFQVMVDGVVVQTYATSSEGYQSVTLDLDLSAGSHTIQFVGTANYPGLDNIELRREIPVADTLDEAAAQDGTSEDTVANASEETADGAIAETTATDRVTDTTTGEPDVRVIKVENDPNLLIDFDTTYSSNASQTVYTEDVWFAQAPDTGAPAAGKVVGSSEIVEGNSKMYAVKLDQAVEHDTWVTVDIHNGTANQASTDAPEYQLPFLNKSQYEYGFESYDTVQFYASNAGWKNWMKSNWRDDDPVLANGPGTDGIQVGSEGLVNDFKVIGIDGHEVTTDSFQVLVRAGSDTSEEFELVANQEIHLGQFYMEGHYGYENQVQYEGNEQFSFKVSEIDGVSVAGDKHNVTIQDAHGNISPIAFDLNGNGKIDTTGDSTTQDHAYNGGETVEIDLDADGDTENVEWMDGSGDGLLVNLDMINGTPVDNGEEQFITETRSFTVKGKEAEYDTSGYRQDFPGIFYDADTGVNWIDLTVPLDGDEGVTSLYLSPFFGWSGTVVLFASNPDSDFVRDFSFSTSGYNTSNVYIDESVSVTTPSWNGTSNQATVSLGNGATSTLNLGGMVSASIYNTPDTWQAPDFYTPGTEDRVETYEVKVENPDFGGVIVDGKALYGDEGGKYANGFEKLSQLEDTNNDGVVDGAELDNLAIWVDDGDGVLEAGELETLEENGIAYISTSMTDVDGKMVGDAGSAQFVDGDAEADGVVRYSLEGDDAAYFQVDALTGQITYADGFVPDFEDPKDIDGDNAYDLVLVRTGDNLNEPERENVQVVVENIEGGVSGTVFNDTNCNDIFDEGDIVVAGATVTLTDEAGQVVDTARTDVDGTYTVGATQNTGDYTVTIAAPDGFGFVDQNAGDDAVDSDVGVDGRATVRLVEGESAVVDAGVTNQQITGTTEQIVLTPQDSGALIDLTTNPRLGDPVDLALTNASSAQGDAVVVDGSFVFFEPSPGFIGNAVVDVEVALPETGGSFTTQVVVEVFPQPSGGGGGGDRPDSDTGGDVSDSVQIVIVTIEGADNCGNTDMDMDRQTEDEFVFVDPADDRGTTSVEQDVVTRDVGTDGRTDDIGTTYLDGDARRADGDDLTFALGDDAGMFL